MFSRVYYWPAPDFPTIVSGGPQSPVDGTDVATLPVANDPSLPIGQPLDASIHRFAGTLQSSFAVLRPF